MAALIDLWDPSAEQGAIAAELRRVGHEVRCIALEDVANTRAELLVLAGDGEGALNALKLLRDEGLNGNVPVVLLGVPAGFSNHGEGPAFGADAVVERPVSFSVLRACIDRLLAGANGAGASGTPPPVPERTLQLSAGGEEPDASQVFELASDLGAPWRPREPTMQLADDDPRRESSGISRGGSFTPAPRHTPTGPGSLRSITGNHSHSGVRTDVPEPVIPPAERAVLSSWFDALLRAADRRVFPDRPPLALHFPAADDPPDALVPPELIEGPSFRIDEPLVEDPIDAFTYVGGPAVPPPIVPSSSVLSEPGDEGPAKEARSTSPETPRRTPRKSELSIPVVEASPTPASDVHATSAPARTAWPVDDTVLGRPAPDGSRRGTLGAGGVLRLLWRAAARAIDGVLEIRCDDGPSVRLCLQRGEVRSIEGPVASTALAELRRLGRATEAPVDEAGAESVLTRRVQRGELARFEHDRLLRIAREGLLRAIVRSEQSQFTLRRAEESAADAASPQAFARPLRAALVEAAGEVFDRARVRALIGAGEVGLALGVDREAGLAAAMLPSELVELLVRMEGCAYEEVLAAAPTEPRLPGIVYALIAADALVLMQAPVRAMPSPHAIASVRSLLVAAAQLAEDGDYFSILGVAPDASAAELERAHRLRCDELRALPLDALGLLALDDVRRDALEAIDEAYRALRTEERRRAYAAAIR